MQFLLLSILLLLSLPASAHIGSPNVFFDGMAGSNRITVSITPPLVVPGLASINVRVPNSAKAAVSVLPVRWDAGTKGAPPPDPALLVKGTSNLYSAQLWLMNSGAYSVFVNVETDQGKGTAVVPLNSIAQTRQPMPPWMGTLFLTVGAILVLLLIAIVGGAVRESTLAPTALPAPPQLLRSRLAMTIATILITLVLLVGKRWWDTVDSHFRNNRLFQTGVLKASVTPGATPELEIAIEAKSWKQDATPLVPEHGKLMHLFLVHREDAKAFAHLHPLQTREHHFRATLPPLPSGDYHLYADITQESGFAQTLTGMVSIAHSPSAPVTFSDEDDSFHFTATSQEEKLLRLELPQKEYRRNEQTNLLFTVHDRAGNRVLLQPYMGMYGHAIIRRHDGAVFTHLHPLGTVSMKSQELFARREKNPRLFQNPADLICGKPDEDLSFPYAFPETGEYHIWLQTRFHNQIHTERFTVQVR